jgi:hypothetical protein
MFSGPSSVNIDQLPPPKQPTLRPVTSGKLIRTPVLALQNQTLKQQRDKDYLLKEREGQLLFSNDLMQGGGNS